MSDPIPPPSLPPSVIPAGWTPTTSTAAGGAIGEMVAQCVIASIEFLIHQPLTSATAAAITGIFIVGAGYVFRDGGRK